MDYIYRIFNPPAERSIGYVIGASVITTLAISAITRRSLQGKQEKIIPNPKKTLLPKLTAAEIDALPYPPDALPDGRDVDSPYGTLRVYEWGPESGRKVLLIHGITTPCLSLGGIAHGLVAKGCRVMLFDLWGRGYSDTPADLEHDSRLYTTQILLAITSSPLPWTSNASSPNGFSLIGYSLGGGIAVSFASYFPSMVNSLVLLAPAGLIRKEHMSMRSHFLYSIGIVPEALLKWGVRRRLQAGPMYRDENKDSEAAQKPSTGKIGVRTVAQAEVEGEATNASHPKTTLPYPPLSLSHPSLTIDPAVQSQLSIHQGFIHSFMSSIRFAPITSQEADWIRLARGFISSSSSATTTNANQILCFIGLRDPIIIPRELRLDVEALMGGEKGGEVGVQWRLIEGAHDFPITESAEVVKEIVAFWGL